LPWIAAMIEPVTDPSVIEGYLTDASNVRGHADGLLRPTSTEEVAAIVRHCQDNDIALTVTAQRTSTTAGPVPFGGWLLSMERMSTIEHIGPDHATAQGGVILGQFQAEIERTGRLFPPDPTSRHECSLGAAIACNASGARSFRYGPTRPWIEAIEVVLPTGQVMNVERGDPVPPDWPVPSWVEPSVKTAAGYFPATDLLDLFIGQEGTLGIITKARVKLVALPEQVLGVLAFFKDRQTAVTAMMRLRDSGRANAAGALSPRCIEYLDHHCLDLCRQRVDDVPDPARAALFCEQEVESVGEEGHLEAWWELLEDVGALADDTIVTTDDIGRAKLHALRHAVPAGVNERVVANGMPKVGTDLAVPDDSLLTMMDAYEAAPVEHVLFGHIGDNHLHLNLLPTNDAELQICRDFYKDLADKAVRLGGTVSAEHGIGKIKKQALAVLLDARTLQEFRRLKRFMDPAWILGRGTLFDHPKSG